MLNQVIEVLISILITISLACHLVLFSERNAVKVLRSLYVLYALTSEFSKQSWNSLCLSCLGGNPWDRSIL